MLTRCTPGQISKLLGLINSSKINTLKPFLKITRRTFKSNSRILPGEERIRVNVRSSEDPSQPIISEDFKNAKTVYDFFHKGWKDSNNGPCLGSRDPKTGKYKWIKFSDVWESAKGIGSGIIEIGYPHGQDTLVGISCRNREEFVFSFLGTCAYSSIIVPFYNHMPQDAVTFVIEQTEIPIFICDTEDKANFVISNKFKFPKLKHLIFIGDLPKSIANSAKSAGIETISFTDLKILGARKLKKIVKPKPENLFTICWTSGTTGMPKGALITHRNIVSALVGVTETTGISTLKGKTTISYMPTGHIYELLSEVQALGGGSPIGFYGGDVLKLMEDIKELKPQVIPMVPRILNRLYHTLLSDIMKHPVKRLFLKTAMNAKTKLLKKGIVKRDTIWDRFVFNGVRDMFGGNADTIITSAAPISSEISQFYRCSTGCHIYDIYGQTEIGGVTISSPYDVEGGNVGVPSIGCMIKLVDVPEMGYLAKDDIGEICAKGPNVTQGYYKNPKSTKETIDEDGWLHTGDVGKWLPNGTLAIVDRKKNLFKLSQGEYISPERIENVYNRSNLIAQIIVEGLSNKEYPIAIVIPDSANFSSWAAHKGFKANNSNELYSNIAVRRAFLKNMKKLGTKGGLTTIEQIKNVYLHPDLLTIEAGHITPTLKMKRNVVKKYFMTRINELYEEGPILEEDLQKLK